MVTLLLILLALFFGKQLLATVCETCGDQGFVEALVDCDSCKTAAVHRYCLGITPVPIEGYITWFCDTCDGSDCGSDREEVKKSSQHSPLLSVVEDQDSTSMTIRKDSEYSSGNSKPTTPLGQSNTPQMSAQPMATPVWRGSISVQEGSIRSIDGLVAHLSTLACPQVHATASSLHTLLSAEMFPRLEIWPKSFLKNGGPKDESIALYFFPSTCSFVNESEFKGVHHPNQKVFDSFVLEMKKNDFGMRCMLDNAELLLFTSYMLPMQFWSFHSKEYLWGVFKPKKIRRR